MDLENVILSSLQTLSLGVKIPAVLTYILIIFIGLPVGLCFLLYEKFAGDPQKRLLNNRLFALTVGGTPLSIATCGEWIAMLRTLGGPVGPVPALIMLVAREFVTIGMVLLLLEILVFRALTIFNWRAASGVDEDFMGFFLPVFNFMIGLFFGLVAFKIGILQDDRYYILTEDPKYFSSKTNLMELPHMIIGLVCTPVMIILMLVTHLKIKSQKKSLANGGNQQQRNNVKFNERSTALEQSWQFCQAYRYPG